MVGAAFLALALQLSPVLWRDDDRKSIPEPKEREIAVGYDIAVGALIQPAGRALDAPRNFRKLIRRPKEAENVNSVDETPDSSWFTNRNFLRSMNSAALTR